MRACLKERAESIGPQSMKAASTDRPPRQPIAWAPQAEQPEFGTSHLSIVDARSRAVATTATPAGADGKLVANRVQPRKRPRSSMSPTLVFDTRDGSLLMSLGSPLGAAIPHFVAKTLMAAFESGLDAQAAIDLPNVATFNGPTLLQAARYPVQCGAASAAATSGTSAGPR